LIQPATLHPGFIRHVQRQHWGTECYHRALKQLCQAERFFVRWKHAIRNHVFCALRAFLQWELKRSRGLIASWYEFQRHLADQAMTNFIQQAVTHPHGA
jgi:hypothetical protein